MRKTERSVRALAEFHSKAFKLISVKPYIIISTRYSINDLNAQLFSLMHICRPAAWIKASAWTRHDLTGYILDGKCAKCKRKINSKFETVLDMQRNKDKLALSSSG